MPTTVLVSMLMNVAISPPGAEKSKWCYKLCSCHSVFADDVKLHGEVDVGIVLQAKQEADHHC